MKRLYISIILCCLITANLNAKQYAMLQVIENDVKLFRQANVNSEVLIEIKKGKTIMGLKVGEFWEIVLNNYFFPDFPPVGYVIEKQVKLIKEMEYSPKQMTILEMFKEKNIYKNYNKSIQKSIEQLADSLEKNQGNPDDYIRSIKKLVKLETRYEKRQITSDLMDIVNFSINLYNRKDNIDKGKVKKDTLLKICKEKYDLIYDIDDDLTRNDMISFFEKSFPENKAELEKIKNTVKKERGIK